MPTKPGKKPPNAGKRGRLPGTPNRVTGTTRELFAAFVDHNAGQVQALFDRVARKNPKAALEVLSRFAEFVLPRLLRQELAASVNVTQDGPPIVVVDANEASRLYQAAMAGLVDPSRLVFQRSRAESLPEPVVTIEQQKPVPSPYDKPHEHEPIADSRCAWCRKLFWENVPAPTGPPQEVEASPESDPAPAPPQGGTVVALRAVASHEHRPVPDSTCPHCTKLWIQS
jgi:hypothetical protein